MFVQCGAPQFCLMVYKPHEYYSYRYHTIVIGTINHSDLLELWLHQLNAIILSFGGPDVCRDKNIEPFYGFQRDDEIYVRWMSNATILAGIGKCPMTWGYWTSPYSSHLVDHIPIMVGWCSMGTFKSFNDPVLRELLSSFTYLRRHLQMPSETLLTDLIFGASKHLLFIGYLEHWAL